jgi:hypothetical protein
MSPLSWKWSLLAFLSKRLQMLVAWSLRVQILKRNTIVPIASVKEFLSRNLSICIIIHELETDLFCTLMCLKIHASTVFGSAQIYNFTVDSSYVYWIWQTSDAVFLIVGPSSSCLPSSPPHITFSEVQYSSPSLLHCHSKFSLPPKAYHLVSYT